MSTSAIGVAAVVRAARVLSPSSLTLLMPNLVNLSGWRMQSQRT